MSASRLALLIGCLAIASGCGGNATPDVSAGVAAVTDDASTNPMTCASEHGDKLGVPFVRICAPGGADAVWIAASPLPCSAGEHETVECPIATPLLVEPALPSGALAPRPTLVTDGFAAHRTCAMRFGGRLPTPAERRDLRRLQGLTAVVGTGAPDGSLQLDELDEWTEVGDCGNPSLPGSGCRFERSPGSSRRAFDWAAMLRCEAAPAPSNVSPDEAITLGDRCPQGPFCLLRSPWFPTAYATPRLHELRCSALASPPIHPAPRPDVAAFRCVLPRAALTPAP